MQQLGEQALDQTIGSVTKWLFDLDKLHFLSMAYCPHQLRE